MAWPDCFSALHCMCSVELQEQRAMLRRQATAALIIQRAYRQWKAAMLRTRLACEEEVGVVLHLCCLPNDFIVASCKH